MFCTSGYLITPAHALIHKNLHTNTQLFKSGVDVALEWIPAHVGTTGNNFTDKLSKFSLNKSIVDQHFPSTIFGVMLFLKMIRFAFGNSKKKRKTLFP